MKLRAVPGGLAHFTLLAGVVLASFAATMAFEGRARAGGDAATAVLGLESLEGAPDNIATEITDALRQRVASTKGYQLVQGKDLVEVKLVFSCPDEGAACMAQAAKSMGATKLIFGNVKRAGTDYQVTLKLLDVNRVAVDSWFTEAVPRLKAEPTVFRSLAPAWLSKLTGKGAGGNLQVRANVPGAAVSLDGTRVGVTGPQPVTIADVAPGRHEVTVEKTGFTTAKQEFSLASGQSLPLSLQLSSMSVEVGAGAAPPQETAPVIVRKPTGAPEPGPGEGGSSSSTMARAGFWVAVVGTVGVLAGGLYFAKQVQDVNTQLDPYRHYPCPGNPNSLCDAKGAPYTPLPGTNAMIQNLEDRGHKDQVLEEVLLISAIPLAIAGGYFLYKGYLDSGSGKETTASARSSRGLRIFPAASASSGGIVTEFDF